MDSFPSSQRCWQVMLNLDMVLSSKSDVLSVISWGGFEVLLSDGIQLIEDLGSGERIQKA